MNFLEWKRVTVIGSQPSLQENVDWISTILNAGENNIQVEWIETRDLTTENAGNVVISPESLLHGDVYGVKNVAKHIREAVHSQIPVVVIVLTGQGENNILHADGLQAVVGVQWLRNVPEALRAVLELPQ